MSQVRIRKRGKTFSYIFETGRKDDSKRKVVEKGGFAMRKIGYRLRFCVSGKNLKGRPISLFWQKDLLTKKFNITPTFKIPTNFEIFQAFMQFLKNVFGFIVGGVISMRFCKSSR